MCLFVSLSLSRSPLSLSLWVNTPACESLVGFHSRDQKQHLAKFLPCFSAINHIYSKQARLYIMTEVAEHIAHTHKRPPQRTPPPVL